MPIRTCRVTSRDAHGIEHTVQVTAQSLFEAVAQALRVFRDHDWSDEPNSDSASVVVAIKPAEVEHRVRIKDFHSWLESAPRGPAEMELKRRLRDLLGR
jgi:hypothetical protein